MKNAQLPAYPVLRIDEDGRPFIAKGDQGISKLEAFTMAAMQGLCSNPKMCGQYGPTCNELVCIAEAAVNVAKATLSELSKHQQP